MSNRKIGNTFEAELCEILASEGFWAHNFTQNKNGQPADVIAVRNMQAYLIDCKVCSNGEPFALSRIESNQELSMSLWEECGNHSGLFAIRFDERIYIATLWNLQHVKQTMSEISEDRLKMISYPFEKWVKSCR